MAITSLTGVQTAIPFIRQVNIFGNQANGGIPRTTAAVFSIPPNPPELKAYLSNANLNYFYSQNIRFGNIMVMDFIWSVIVANSTALQTVTTPGIGNRDINGTPRGDGVYLFVWTGGNLTSGTTTLSVNYTSSDGNIGRVGTSIPFSSAQGQRGFFINLANGDTGVRSVQSAQWSALPGGGMSLWALRPIAVIPAPSGVSGDAKTDAISLGMPEVYNGSNIIILYNETGQVYGQMKFLYG